MNHRTALLCASMTLSSLLACSQPAPEPATEAESVTCTPPRPLGRLPRALNEASGVAASLRHPGIWWILTDDGPPRLTALDSTGAVRATVAVAGAVNTDWESLTSARCGAGSCLFIGDVGDNQRLRRSVQVYRLPEPALSDKSVRAERFNFQYPDGALDAEAIFVLPEQRLFVVTKGRSEPLTVYRNPGPFEAGKTVTLEPLQRLSESFVQLPEMVTGAGATPDGKWIVIRTYGFLQLYRLVDDYFAPQLPGSGVDLTPAGEFQGEGVDISASGRVFLVSEKGLDERDAPISVLSCKLTS